MKKIVAFTGSNSNASINQKLVNYASTLVKDAEVDNLDLRNFNIPIYGIDHEKNQGIPQDVSKLVNILNQADGFIISSPEHNSLMPAFFKNILDWLSRTGVKYFNTNPILILATSPGKGGGAKVLRTLESILPYTGGQVVGTFGLPAFNDNFQNGRIVSDEYDRKLRNLINLL